MTLVQVQVGLCSALMMGLFAASARAAETPAGAPMTKLVTRLLAPKPAEDSLAPVHTELVRSGTTHARILMTPAKKGGPKKLLLITEPDGWMIDVATNTAMHRMDPPDEAYVSLPVLPPDPENVPKELHSLQWGQELAYMEAHHATVKGHTRVLKVEDVTVQLELHPKTKLPKRIKVTDGDRTALEVEYLAYEVNVPFDAALFRPAADVKIVEEPAEEEENEEEPRQQLDPTAPATATGIQLLSPEADFDASVGRKAGVDFIVRAQTVGTGVLRRANPSAQTEMFLKFTLKPEAPTTVEVSFDAEVIPTERAVRLGETIGRLLPSPEVKGKPVSFLMKFVLRSAEEIAAADKALAARPPPWGLTRPSDEDVASVKTALAEWEAGKAGGAFQQALVVGGALWTRIIAQSAEAKEIGTNSSFFQDMKEKGPAGRTIAKAEDFKALLATAGMKAIGARFSKGVVRAASTWERKLFYQMIPFEIDQAPLTVVELGDDLLVVSMNKGQVVWIELLVDAPAGD